MQQACGAACAQDRIGPEKRAAICMASAGDSELATHSLLGQMLDQECRDVLQGNPTFIVAGT